MASHLLLWFHHCTSQWNNSMVHLQDQGYWWRCTSHSCSQRGNRAQLTRGLRSWVVDSLTSGSMLTWHQNIQISYRLNNWHYGFGTKAAKALKRYIEVDQAEFFNDRQVIVDWVQFYLTPDGSLLTYPFLWKEWKFNDETRKVTRKVCTRYCIFETHFFIYKDCLLMCSFEVIVSRLNGFSPLSLWNLTLSFLKIIYWCVTFRSSCGDSIAPVW